MNAPKTNYVIADFDTKAFYKPRKGSHLYDISFKTYSECEKWITENKIKDHNPELGFELGLGKYHESWDWLMPIIDRIESFGYKFQMCRKQVYILPDTGVYAEIIFSAKCESKIESAYQAVLWFIKNVNHDNN